jgi:hypothetical protein
MSNRNCPRCNEVLKVLQSSGRMVCRSCGWVSKPTQVDSQKGYQSDVKPPIRRNLSSADMDEEALYVNNNVKVTNTRFIVGETTYTIRNITSIKMTITPPPSGCAIVVICFGIIFLLGTLGTFSKDPVSGFMLLLMACLVIGGGIDWLRKCKPEYNVVIVSSSGENRALTSTDKHYIEDIVDSINDAIVLY